MRRFTSRDGCVHERDTSLLSGSRQLLRHLRIDGTTVQQESAGRHLTAVTSKWFSVSGFATAKRKATGRVENREDHRGTVNRFTVNMCRKVYIEDKITMYSTATNIRIFLTSLSKRSFQTDKLTTKQNVILCVLKELTACGLRSQFRWVAERVDTEQFNKYLANYNKKISLGLNISVSLRKTSAF